VDVLISNPNSFTPTEKYYYIKLLNSQKPTSVVLGGQAITTTDSTKTVSKVGALADSCDLTADVNAYCFNATEQSVLIKVMDSGKSINVEVREKEGGNSYLPIIVK